MVVNLLEGIETASVLRHGWSILKDTNSAASYNALVLIPGSSDLCPGLLSRLHIHIERFEMNRQFGMLKFTPL